MCFRGASRAAHHRVAAASCAVQRKKKGGRLLRAVSWRNLKQRSASAFVEEDVFAGCNILRRLLRPCGESSSFGREECARQGERSAGDGAALQKVASRDCH